MVKYHYDNIFENDIRGFENRIAELSNESRACKKMTDSFIYNAMDMGFPDELQTAVSEFCDQALAPVRRNNRLILGEFLIEAFCEFAHNHCPPYDDDYDESNTRYVHMKNLPNSAILLLLTRELLMTHRRSNEKAFISCFGTEWGTYDLEFGGMRWTRRGRIILSDALMHRIPPRGSFTIGNPDD